MAIKPKQEKQAEPRYFEAIGRVLTPQIADLSGAGEYVPPFEFMITDADRRLVLQAPPHTVHFKRILDFGEGPA